MKINLVIALVDEQRRVRRNDAIRRDSGSQRSRKSLRKSRGIPIWKNSRAEAREVVECIVLLYGKVISVGVVRKGLVADAVARAYHVFARELIRQPNARSKVFVVLLHTQV